MSGYKKVVSTSDDYLYNHLTRYKKFCRKNGKMNGIV
jgi:hypothetical protein